jgi:hypothetical protein
MICKKQAENSNCPCIRLDVSNVTEVLAGGKVRMLAGFGLSASRTGQAVRRPCSLTGPGNNNV